MTAERVSDQPDGADEVHPDGAPVSEQPQAEGAEQAAQQVGEDLDELDKTQQERDEYLELAQRTRADFENYRRRVASETAAAATRGKAELARELIPAIDNLERALRAAGVDPDAGGGGSSEDPVSQEVSGKDALAQGVALVYRELRTSLERAGVETYDPVGEEFDPSLHEALSTRADEAKPGRVVETVDRGYRLNGQVLRPARVVVSE